MYEVKSSLDAEKYMPQFEFREDVISFLEDNDDINECVEYLSKIYNVKKDAVMHRALQLGIFRI